MVAVVALPVQPGRQDRCRVRALVELEGEAVEPLQTAVPCGLAIREPQTPAGEQVPASFRTAATAGPASSSSRYREARTMAHYAEIDTDNRVIRVLVVANEVTHATPDGSEDEALGATFLANLLGGEWVATSYNGNKRVRYAGPGYILDRERDEFVPPGWSLVDGVWTAPPAEPLP